MTTPENTPPSSKGPEVRNATWLVNHLIGTKDLFAGRTPRATEVACVVAEEAFRQLQLGKSVVEIDPVTQVSTVTAPDSVFLGNHVNVGNAARSMMDHLGLPGNDVAAGMASEVYDRLRIAAHAEQ